MRKPLGLTIVYRPHCTAVAVSRRGDRSPRVISCRRFRSERDSTLLGPLPFFGVAKPFPPGRRRRRRDQRPSAESLARVRDRNARGDTTRPVAAVMTHAGGIIFELSDLGSGTTATVSIHRATATRVIVGGHRAQWLVENGVIVIIILFYGRPGPIGGVVVPDGCRRRHARPENDKSHVEREKTSEAKQPAWDGRR